jgi:hypothetical protein
MKVRTVSASCHRRHGTAHGPTPPRRHAATPTSRVMRVCGTLCTVGEVGAAPLPPSLPEAPAPAGHAWTSTAPAAVSAPAPPASGPLTQTRSPHQALAWGTQGAEAKPVHEHPFHGAHGRRRRRWGDGAARALAQQSVALAGSVRTDPRPAPAPCSHARPCAPAAVLWPPWPASERVTALRRGRSARTERQPPLSPLAVAPRYVYGARLL